MHFTFIHTHYKKIILCRLIFLGNFAGQDPATGYIPLLQSFDLLPIESQIPKGSLQEVDGCQK